jgi:hypothetical protein
MIALPRIAREEPPDGSGDVAAGVLLATTLLFMLAPGGLFLLPPPWNTSYVILQTIVWFATLGFLASRASRSEPDS